MRFLTSYRPINSIKAIKSTDVLNVKYNKEVF